MNTDMTYSEAFDRLRKVVAHIEDNNIKLDELAGRVKEANELITYCENKLRGIEAEVAKG